MGTNDPKDPKVKFTELRGAGDSKLRQRLEAGEMLAGSAPFVTTVRIDWRNGEPYMEIVNPSDRAMDVAFYVDYYDSKDKRRYDKRSGVMRLPANRGYAEELWAANAEDWQAQHRGERPA